MATKTDVQITTAYSTCCFCEKPKYPAGSSIPYYPRFLFRKAAKEYAKQYGLSIFQWGRNGHKSALAYTGHKCPHFDNNVIRLDWGIVY